MNRGDIITVLAPDDYGQPRRAVIIQSDILNAAESVLVALLTRTETEALLDRLTLILATTNGLKSISQIIVDKILAYSRQKCGPVLSHLSGTEILGLNTMLSVMIGLAD